MTRPLDLAPPRNWQDFEDLCLDLFRELWDVPTAQKNGREFQPQQGVDIFGFWSSESPQWFGIQCKKKQPGSKLTESELLAEVEKAKGFNPPLSRFALATTARCDAVIQEVARELTEAGPFEVMVYDWDHFCIDLVGRTNILRKHLPELFQGDGSILPPPGTQDATEALDAFRHRHWSQLLPLPSLAQARGQRNNDLLLTEVYTALDVTDTVTVSRSEESREGGGSGIKGSGIKELPRVSLPGDFDYLEALIAREQSLLEADDSEHAPERRERRCLALEAAAANRRLVLVGAPGSGKSTFGRFLALCLLGASLNRAEANLSTLLGEVEGGGHDFVAWPHGSPLAIFVSLQKFQSSESFPPTGEEGDARHLIDFLEQQGPKASRRAFARGLAKVLKQENGALVILDGLDETPSAEASRVQLRQAISGLARAYPSCRILVTSRPYAYRADSPWRLDDADFASVELAAFDSGQQQTFIAGWYRRLVARGLLLVDEEREQAMARDLVGQIGRTRYLSPLAESPLMLTMMTDLHASHGGSLPTGGRAALYRESVELLLDRWNETREGTKPTDVLGMPLEQIRRAIELLAFQVHRSRGAGEGEPPEIQRAELWDALDSIRRASGPEGSPDDRRIMDYLHQRSGILLGESESIYRFPHRSYQEYLAASYLVGNEFPGLLEKVVEEDPALWREVVPLATGQVQPFMAWTIVETLVPMAPLEGDLAKDDPRGFRALLAGLAIRECQLLGRQSSADAAKCERVRRWLLRVVELGLLDVRDRAQAGQVLGLLGDDRPGVGVCEDGLPALEWVEIPSSSFVMGGERHDDEKPVHDETVEGFRISRYPVTNAQYRSFVEAGGYTDHCRSCWTDAGWDWKGDRVGPRSYGDAFDLPNHPRVGVSWYEAVAYCRWISERTGRHHRLPTESEWERAARGEDGREYPWGPEFDSDLGNVLETGLRTTTAVGLFPGGESPAGATDIGILDASGNVLEWCSTKGRENYKKPADDDLEGSSVRVLRGGSFAGFGIGTRCACRLRDRPGLIDYYVGFRLVAPSLNR